MLKIIEIDGKPYRWKELLRLRREQAKAARQRQLVLFDLKNDARPESQRTASGRLIEPSLFRD